MKKLLVAALIVPLALLGAARPAKAGSEAGAILTGVVVGVGAALILDAITSPPVVAAPPPVVYQPAPVVVQTPPPVVYAPPPRIVYTPPPVVYAPPPVIYTPPPVIYRPAPVIVSAPRYGPPLHRVYHRNDHGKRYWKETYKRRDN